MTIDLNTISTAIAWCLAWGEGRKPQFGLPLLKQMREALNQGKTEVPEEVKALVRQAQRLQEIDKNYFPTTLNELKEKYSDLWNQETKIGLVYGGATQIKQYVFESSKLQEIRGASTLLDRINLVDLPAFFNKKQSESNIDNTQYNLAKNWLNCNFPNHPDISEALIPEMVIYSTGGNLLALCPAAFVDDLANAIEKRYVKETLTANSCAVGERFRLLELRFGLFNPTVENTPWLDWYHQNYNKPLVQAYFGFPGSESERVEQFKNRKSFNELTTKLAVLFNQRRSGNDVLNRPSRRYPPMFETHPYLRRDRSERRSAVTSVQPPKLPRETDFSETSARQHLVGYRAKKGSSRIPEWYAESQLGWELCEIEGWVNKFDRFLDRNPALKHKYYKDIQPGEVKIAENLSHLGNASQNFIAYIYADGNNVGGYIQKEIRTPQEYQRFSEDVQLATEYAVYNALAENLHPHKLKNFNDEDSTLSTGDLVHPFEIITIGGDDIFLIVPADRALAIAQLIGQRFEQILLKEPLFTANSAAAQIQGDYQIQSSNSPTNPQKIHRYKPLEAPPTQCKLSISSSILIAAYRTPTYYAKDFIDQLLKSAKERAKTLKKVGYCGGTVDIMTLKSVTMISSDVKEFRQEALFKKINQNLKLYAAPYTLHELEGLIASIKALKNANFPKSQLYQIRSLLEQGKHVAILNYRYFRTRLKQGKKELREQFEEAWCQAKTNEGNLAPWMYDKGELERDKSNYPLYETIWRDMVDLYEFIALENDDSLESEQVTVEDEL
ncbi:MAG: type III-B CRISPR-associated protein Cas10/Cmr2 [Cyanobacteriota bacterium]|nr:type III-B CRISPR-associated protein Cas10/Cmr2 [Cyanobacteriota bacterium]